ncbi:hypothetical protein WG954_13660 [Lacibacter sp. H375]|uniref:hypothetical protein n=1 Tax=Lacibacter sp. H375 TaxID=3133424 RepID=UPI0030BE8F8D
MTEIALDTMLSQLGYSRKWIDNGILTETLLKQQFQEFNLGEDDNTEHYRFRTLAAFLQASTFKKERILEGILEILENDSDQSMASSVFISLLENEMLTSKQFEMVADSFKKFGEWTQKYINEEKIKRM